MFSFYNPWKRQKARDGVFWRFQGYRKGILAWNGLRFWTNYPLLLLNISLLYDRISENLVSSKHTSLTNCAFETTDSLTYRSLFLAITMSNAFCWLNSLSLCFSLFLKTFTQMKSVYWKSILKKKKTEQKKIYLALGPFLLTLSEILLTSFSFFSVF